MKKLFKFLFISVFASLAIIVLAFVAAPYLVRQEQVINFIETSIKLPDNKKVKIEPPIEFGFFPYAHLKTAKAMIVSGDGLTQTFENLLFGFNLKDLITKNIVFNLQAKFEGVDYKGDIGVDDYSNFLKNENTKIDIKVENPVPFTLTGDLKTSGNKKTLNNFVLTHKQTVVKGNIELTANNDKSSTIKGSAVLDTTNIDDLRRLVDFKNYNDAFNATSGKGKFIISFATVGSNDYQLKRNLNAEGSMKITDAAIYGIDLMEYVTSMGQIKITKDASKKIDINSVDSAFMVNKGVANVSNLSAVNPFANAKANGKIDIADELINALVELNANVQSGNVNLPLQVSGSLKNPQVKPIAVKAVINNVNQLQQLTGKIKNEKVRNTLQGVFDALGANTGENKNEPASKATDPLGNLINSIGQ